VVTKCKGGAATDGGEGGTGTAEGVHRIQGE